jgi:DNA-binding response OmpR family regulator
MRVLVVDDDPELLELVATSLSRDGHRVRSASDLAGAREALAEEVELVVLDLGLPDGSGLSLCRELRGAGRATPILLLTARSAVSQRVAGLDAGADDYLTKPFALAELRARVRALGRRRGAPPAPQLSLGSVELDLSGRRAYREGDEVELTDREWTILEILAVRRGRAVSRAAILEEGWGEETEAAAASLEVLVGRIRRKLGREVIRTVRGIGYALG